MRKVTIYTDGAYKSKSKRGGIGYLLIDNETGAKKSCSRGYTNTSSDRMELMAVAEALKALRVDKPRGFEVELFTDSGYVADSINKGRLGLWLTDPNFMNRKNEDLWKLINELMKIHKVTVTWVKSHANCEGNRFADQLANVGCADKTPTDDAKNHKKPSTPLQQSLFEVQPINQTHYR
jgi:ribonuclease HI